MPSLHSRSSLVVPLLSALCLGLGMAACGPVEEPSAEPVKPGVEVQDTILAEVDVGYGTVRFHEFTAPGGNKTLAIQELAPATLAKTPMDALQESGGLTSLEVFKAVAPEREPPQALVDSHAQEALAMGREDTRVLQARFDKDAAVEKSIASCEGWVYQVPDPATQWNLRLSRNSVSGYQGLNLGRYVDDQGYATVGTVTLGTCNESDVPIQTYLAWDDTQDNNSWLNSPWYDIPAYTAGRWWNFTNTRYYCPNPLPPPGLCLTQIPIRYQIWANSTSGKLYHLRTAELGVKQCTSSAQCPTHYACAGGYCSYIVR